MSSMFSVGKNYTKNEIYELLQVPKESRKGSWDTGYRSYNGDIFIFSNVGIPGRTGHDYNNYWDGDLFVWEGKRTSHLKQPLLKKMLHPGIGQRIFLFTRTNDKSPFTYEGEVSVKNFQDTTPVKITWQFAQKQYDISDEAGNTFSEPVVFYEGAISEVKLTKHERNPLARRMCIEHFGCFCQVCSFDFYKQYGELGKDYIQVHHLVPIASIKYEYSLNPEKDLIPVCPNCHVMIHYRDPMLSIDELREILKLK